MLFKVQEHCSNENLLLAANLQSGLRKTEFCCNYLHFLDRQSLCSCYSYFCETRADVNTQSLSSAPLQPSPTRSCLSDVVPALQQNCSGQSSQCPPCQQIQWRASVLIVHDLSAASTWPRLPWHALLFALLGASFPHLPYLSNILVSSLGSPTCWSFLGFGLVTSYFHYSPNSVPN